MSDHLTAVTECFYLDDEQHIFFCASDFLAQNGLPNTHKTRKVIAQEVKKWWPEVSILEEDN
jgi:hypothetical protein